MAQYKNWRHSLNIKINNKMAYIEQRRQQIIDGQFIFGIDEGNSSVFKSSMTLPLFDKSYVLISIRAFRCTIRRK